jgi:hypothetical protein
MPWAVKARPSSAETAWSAAGTRPGLEHGDVGPEVLEDGRDLAACVGAADDRGPSGQAGQGRDVLVGERQVGAGDREPARVPADGQDDAVRGPGAPVVGGHRVRPGETDRAQVLDQVDALPADMPGHVLLVVGVAGHPLAVGQHGGQVGHGGGTAQAEGGPRRPVAREAGGAGQRADRRRAAVQAGAADLVGFEQGDPRAELAGLQGRGDPGGPAAHNQEAAVSHGQRPGRRFRPPGPGRTRAARRH